MELLSTQQAARQLGVSERRVRSLIAEGKLSAHRLGRDYAIERSALATAIVYGKPGRPPKPKAEAQPVGAAELKQPQQFVAGAAEQGTAANGVAQAVTVKPKRKAVKRKGQRND